jgi:hypothetical protein
VDPITRTKSVDLRILGTDPAAGEAGFFVAPRTGVRGHGSHRARQTGWPERIQRHAEVGDDASRRVAEKAGCMMEGLRRQALVIDGVRHDCWTGSLPREDVA